MMEDDDGGARVLCCECGTPTQTNPTNMCIDCLRSKVDITEGIARQVAQNHCRGCNRFERSGGWVACEPESKELLAILLKRVRGLDQVRLVDASFVWTEAHSKRIKLKLVVQKEVILNAVLQQTLVVEFVVANRQCEKCQRVEAKDYWVSVVQVRQKVQHKRTMFWLEQLILRHNAHADASSISEMRDGLDFFHSEKNASEKLVSFLQTVAPLRYKTARQMITHDTHTGVHRNKYTFSVELVPVCKDDLVCLPKETAAHLSNVCPLVLCTKVANNLHFVDVGTLKGVELSAQAFFKRPFRSLCTREHLRDFVVLDVSPLLAPQQRGHAKRGTTSSQLGLADITVARVSDLGKNDTQYVVRSHLGGVLKAGDHAKGYDLAARNIDATDVPSLPSAEQLPDVLLVRKAYSHAKRRRRVWRLKQLRKEADDGLSAMDVERSRADYETFLRDLEEDKEMRSGINLYKDHAALQALRARGKHGTAPERATGAHAAAADDEADAGAHGSAGRAARGRPAPEPMAEEEDELSEAEVGLEELLDDLTLGANEVVEGDSSAPFELPDGPGAAKQFHFT